MVRELDQLDFTAFTFTAFTLLIFVITTRRVALSRVKAVNVALRLFTVLLAQQLKLEDPHRGGVVGMEPVAHAAARAATAHRDGGRAVG